MSNTFQLCILWLDGSQSLCIYICVFCICTFFSCVFVYFLNTFQLCIIRLDGSKSLCFVFVYFALMYLCLCTLYLCISWTLSNSAPSGWMGAKIFSRGPICPLVRHQFHGGEDTRKVNKEIGFKISKLRPISLLSHGGGDISKIDKENRHLGFKNSSDTSGC